MSEKPLIVLPGQPPWAKSIEQQLSAAYEVAHFVERPNYVPRLTDAHAAMILVDGQDPDWRFWITAAKANNATRRIPVLIVTDSPAQRREAILAGADLSAVPARPECADSRPRARLRAGRIAGAN